jgi:hypothetical protein
LGFDIAIVETSRERSLRWFVGLSLVVGAFVLLGGGIQFGNLVGAPSWVLLLAGVVAVILAVFTATWEGGTGSPMAPAAAWIGTVLLAMLWASVDSSGHAFLGGFAAVVALAVGVGLLRRHLWAWPVAFASVTGFGPIVLLLTPMGAGVRAAGFALFFADVLALLGIHRTYFEPRR